MGVGAVVAFLLSSGATTVYACSCGPRTNESIEKNVGSIMDKLMVSRRTQIAVIAVTQGWGDNRTGNNKDTNEGK